MEAENENEGQYSTFLTRAAVLLVQCVIVGVVGGIVATGLILIVRIGQ